MYPCVETAGSRLLLGLLPIRQLGSNTLLQSLAVAAGGNRQIQNTSADSVEIDDFLIILTDGLAAGQNLAELGMDVLIFDDAIFPYQGRCAMGIS